jgi:hypothetical protein
MYTVEHSLAFEKKETLPFVTTGITSLTQVSKIVGLNRE